jgi:hypothetical protein
MKRGLRAHLVLSGLLGLGTLLAAGRPAGAVLPPAGGAPLPPPRVTLISDSVGATLLWHPEARVYLAEGLDLRLEALACRRLAVPGCNANGANPPSALETIRSLGQELGPVVIVDVGYNDPPDEYASGLDPVMQALVDAHVERVVWLTLAEHEDVWAETNVVIRAAVTRWPRLVVDWAPLATENPDWFADSAHLNAAGATGFAHFLRPIVLAALATTPPARQKALPAERNTLGQGR